MLFKKGDLVLYRNDTGFEILVRVDEDDRPEIGSLFVIASTGTRKHVLTKFLRPLWQTHYGCMEKP